MKQIQLTQNQVALVDDDIYEELSQFKWYAKKAGKTFYAVRMSLIINGKRHVIRMHHKIIGLPPKKSEIDHINGCGTDNRRENLRLVTHRQNLQNQKNGNKNSKYPGVCLYNQESGGCKWRALIVINGKQKYLGLFTDEKKAFEAYKQAVNKIGEKMIGEI